MSEKEELIARQIIFPPATLKRLERDAKASGRSFNDQTIYVLIVGLRELDGRPPLPKVRHKPKRGAEETGEASKK